MKHVDGVSQIQVAQDTRGERVKHVSGWQQIGSFVFHCAEGTKYLGQVGRCAMRLKSSIGLLTACV